jgi:hypothetical protein|tara:strand:- start:264 stop:407 length:144 start_codon:yes stop_codon:yes gene_type:complete
MATRRTKISSPATEKIEIIRDLLENAPLDVISAETLYHVVMDVIENN